MLVKSKSHANIILIDVSHVSDLAILGQPPLLETNSTVLNEKLYSATLRYNFHIADIHTIIYVYVVLFSLCTIALIHENIAVYKEILYNFGFIV